MSWGRCFRNQRQFILLASIAIAAVSSAAEREVQDPEKLQPGDVMLQGERVGDRYLVQIEADDLAVADGTTVVGIDVFAQPSDTHLVRIMDVGHIETLAGFQADSRDGIEPPRASMASDLTEPLAGRLSFTPPPPKEDDRIRLELISEEKGEMAHEVFTDVRLGSLDGFKFKANIAAAWTNTKGGGTSRCGWCGGDYCGCKICKGVEWQLCCPQCEIYCRYVWCPSP